MTKNELAVLLMAFEELADSGNIAGLTRVIKAGVRETSAYAAKPREQASGEESDTRPESC